MENLRIFFSHTKKWFNSKKFHFPGKALKTEKWKTENCSRTPENGKQKMEKKNPYAHVLFFSMKKGLTSL